jgi:hypothetical protein
MVIRLWRRGNYPNKHTGIYQDATDDPYEDVKFFQGERIELDHELKFIFAESRLAQLDKLGCLWTNINPPLVNWVIGEVILQHAEKDVQLFRTHIIGRDGETQDYYLVNVAALVHCIDYEKSVIREFWPDGQARGIWKLRFKSDECMEGRAIARLQKYHQPILVSEELYQAFKELNYKGWHFELDRDGDNRGF